MTANCVDCGVAKLSPYGQRCRECSKTVMSKSKRQMYGRERGYEMTPQVKETIIRRYLAGEQAQALAEEFGISKGYVINMALNAGYRKRPIGPRTHLHRR